MAVALDQFAKSLAATGIMSAEEIKALYEALPAAERPRDGDTFAQLLLARGKLTEFQIQHLLAGRGAALTVGEYLLTDRIGAGGMGQVFKARHLRMQRTVAVKMMSPAAMKDEASVRRFQREVRAVARLEHQNIVTAYDAGQAGKTHFLVMQYVDGGDLAQLLKAKGPLPIEQACNFISQAARGLAYAHAEGIIHRDIKPANLLIDKKGSVKILDMGLARVVEGNDDLTGSEQVMGTVDYMSPEQASESKEADARSDIYSLGCTLWFLLTGKRLFDADSVISRLVKHRDEPPPSLVRVRDDAPWSLEQTLHKMVAKRADDRFQAMEEVVAALEPFANHGAGGMGSSVLRDAGLSSFLQGMGSQTGGASKIGGGSSSIVRPASSGILRPGSASEVLPLSDSRVGIGLDSKSGMKSGLRPASKIGSSPSIHAATVEVASQGTDTDPGMSTGGGSKSSGIGRKPAAASYSSTKKPKNALPLILGGAAVIVVAVAGALALNSSKPKPDDVAVAPPAAPVAPAPKPAVVNASNSPFAQVAAPKQADYAAERRVAEWAIGKGGMVGVAYGNAGIAEHRDRNSLPSGPWTIRRLSLADRRNVGDGELPLLASLAELELLNLNNAGVTFKCLPYITRLTTLRTLELTGANVRDADLDYLLGMTTLTALNLNGSSVSEDGIAKLKKMPLRRLELGSIVAGNSLGKVLLNFPDLQTLRLNSVGLNDSGVKELAALKKLETLTLSSLPISDDALKSIAGWTQLRDLEINGGGVTPSGIKVLAALTGLRRFEIEGLGMLRAEMVAMQEALPDTEVWLNNARVMPKKFPLPPEPPPAVPHNTLSAAEQAAGWKLLFDGQTLNGWKQYRGPTNPGGWWVVEGQLRTDGGGPYLATVDEHSHYELSVEVRLSSDGNSGLYYCVDESQDPPTKTGPELELMPNDSLGAIWSVGPQQTGVKMNPPDAWHRVQVTTAPVGARHTVLGPDGKTLFARTYLRDSAEVKNSSAAKDPNFWKSDVGKVVLQSRSGMIAFRNLKLRPLPPDEATKLVSEQ